MSVNYYEEPQCAVIAMELKSIVAASLDMPEENINDILIVNTF